MKIVKMKAASSSVLHKRNRLLLQTVPNSRTLAQSRRALTTSIPAASPSSSSPHSAHGHGHGKAFNSSLAIDGTAAGSNPVEFVTRVNRSEASRKYQEPTSPIKQHEKLVQS